MTARLSETLPPGLTALLDQMVGYVAERVAERIAERLPEASNDEPAAPEVLTIPEAAKLLRVSQSLLATMRRERRGPEWYYVGHRKCVRYTRAAIETYRQQQERGGSDAS